MSAITTMPRTIVRASLQGLRLPLTTVELITHRGGSDWAPAVTYESFEATAKRIVGSLLRDDELVREGRLQQAKVGELSEADRSEAKAELQRQEAEAVLADQQRSAEEARLRTSRRAQEREQELSQMKAARQHDIQEKTRSSEETAAKVAQGRSAAVSAQETKAERTRVAQKSAAVAERRKALDAAKKAGTLETALEVKKVQRKTR